VCIILCGGIGVKNLSAILFIVGYS
jgi:hypothetical protein